MVIWVSLVSPKNPDSPTLAELYRAVMEVRDEFREFKAELKIQETRLDELRSVEREHAIRISNNEQNIKTLGDRSWQIIAGGILSVITGFLGIFIFKK